MSNTNAKAKVIGPEATALINTLKANPGRAFTFAELAAEAGVPAKTGYLRSVKENIGEANLEIGKAEKLVTRKVEVNTYTYAGDETAESADADADDADAE